MHNDRLLLSTAPLLQLKTNDGVGHDVVVSQAPSVLQKHRLQLELLLTGRHPYLVIDTTLDAPHGVRESKAHAQHLALTLPLGLVAHHGNKHLTTNRKLFLLLFRRNIPLEGCTQYTVWATKIYKYTIGLHFFSAL